ncbi:hypothetical protein [Micromonospora maritima]|uniref:hypothetical protein n=1 Tax=Micromonospora maritima TaxID=986711 RepID=UPI00157DECB9|nr:hypothetical protein [Micromonospora maritima]
MSRLVMADLFCGEGGAAAGYVAAGFEVHGFDIVHPDPEKRAKLAPEMRRRYLASGAASFTVADANTVPLAGFDAVHKSPPCKDHTDLAAQSGGDGTGWMLPHAIDRARASGLPYVIENVESPSAKQHMDGAFMLCGSSFGLGAAGRILKRHRLFLTNVPLLAPPCVCSGWPVGGVYGTGGAGQMTRGYKFHPDDARRAMGIGWMSRAGLSQAIPPAYTRFIGEQILDHLAARTRTAA